MLLYKFLRHDITGHIYRIIKSMYSVTKYRVKINNLLSPQFDATQQQTRLPPSWFCNFAPILFSFCCASDAYQKDMLALQSYPPGSLQMRGWHCRVTQRAPSEQKNADQKKTTRITKTARRGCKEDGC